MLWEWNSQLARRFKKRMHFFGNPSRLPRASTHTTAWHCVLAMPSQKKEGGICPPLLLQYKALTLYLELQRVSRKQFYKAMICPKPIIGKQCPYLILMKGADEEWHSTDVTEGSFRDSIHVEGNVDLFQQRPPRVERELIRWKGMQNMEHKSGMW